MSRVSAWTLFVVTALLVPAAVALSAVGVYRDPSLGDGWSSRLLLTLIGGCAALLYAVVGSLIARAEPRNAIGWILLGAAALLAVVITAFAYVDVSLTRPAGLPASDWVDWLGNWCFVPAVFVTPALIAQNFPDGRPLPGRWSWLLWSSVAIAAGSTLVTALDPSTVDTFGNRIDPMGIPDWLADVTKPLNAFSGAVLAPVVFVASLAALVVRFRRSRGIERQQMKWLAFAGAVPVAGFTLSFTASPLVGDGVVLDAIFVTAFASVMLIPIAVAFAILRYRLYEIDRVISRTLVYGSLTVVLGGAYAGLVLAGQGVFSSFAGGSNLAIAGSTLVVAALALPLRARVQRLVDRRFYRRRYDAQRTLEEFGARLRREVDLETLQADLRAVVAETMQPAHASLWLRSGAR